MDYLVLIGRLLLFTIFFSSGLDKMKDFNTHLETLKDYKIIPPSFIKLSGVIGIFLELVLSTFLLVGIFLKVTTFLLGLLLVTYTLFISINLIRGRNNISCGCGGVLGEKVISSSLVFRNIIFILIAGIILFTESYLMSIDGFFIGMNVGEIVTLEVFATLFTFILVVLLVQIFRKSRFIYKNFSSTDEVTK
ncbi:DoxX family protein [Bacillus sp. SCS-153A]|uniref:DoxX family protein n=1 Tax=Rossellomorea sedimentorum TaxID=3115294 RepID=UPI003905C519